MPKSLVGGTGMELFAMARVPEVFIDGFGEISFKEGLIRIELVSLSDEEPEVRQRLIMTTPAFLHAVQLQQNMVAKFEEAGIIRARRNATVVPAPAPAAAVAAPAAPTLAVSPGPPKSPNFSDS
jgi:hypothetical protein